MNLHVHVHHVCVYVHGYVCIQGGRVGVGVHDCFLFACHKVLYCFVQGQWFYALLINLQKPLTPESCSWLRQLARICSIIRATLVGLSPSLMVSFVCRWMCTKLVISTAHSYCMPSFLSISCRFPYLMIFLFFCCMSKLYACLPMPSIFAQPRNLLRANAAPVQQASYPHKDIKTFTQFCATNQMRKVQCSL